MAGEVCMRIILAIVNVIFTVLGLAFFVVGLTLRFGRSLIDNYIDLDKLADEVPSIGSNYGASENSGGIDVDGLLSPVATFLIVFGLFFLIIGITGMVGACCKVKCMLLVYIVIVGLILLGKIIVLIMLLTNFGKDRVKSYIEEKMQKDYEGLDDFSVTGLAMTALMIQKKCCGVDDYSTFDDSESWDTERTYSDGSQNITVTLITPIACCKMEGDFPSVTPVESECAYEPSDTNNNWKTGCYGKIEDDIDEKKNEIIGGIVGLILFSLLCMIFGILILRQTMKDSNEIV